MPWTALGAAPGIYSVGLRLIDANGLFNPSGTFHFDAEVAAPVPLPAALALLGAVLLVLRRRTDRRGASARESGQARASVRPAARVSLSRGTRTMLIPRRG